MRDAIELLVTAAVSAAIQAGELPLDTVPEPGVERPRDASHGDWATTVALRCAKPAGLPPRQVAEIIARHLKEHDDVAAVEIAGPGFVNLRLSPAALQRVVRSAREQDATLGSSELGAGRRVQVEFVSANPVGPMHVGHGRWAALGDSMGRILAHTGWLVEREFYVNDAGVQMDLFAQSVSARYLEFCGSDAPFPENGYHGTYIREIASEIFAAEGTCWLDASPQERERYFGEKAYVQVLAHLQRVLHDFGVDFDVWFSERTLHESTDGAHSAVESAISDLRERGHIYDSEGAVWFRSTPFGDDKDRVLVKADGSYTYFAADIAYHKNKFDRGFDRVINIWGADHHGYVARMKAAVAALGHEGALDVVIGQLVNLFRDGEAVRMSKRTGEMVTFEELVGEVGADASRYWFLRRSTDQQVDFDIAAAKQQSADNPVYYVQYAYARICSILRKAAGDGADAGGIDEVADALIATSTDLSPLDADSELALMRKLDEFSEVVELASRELSPYKLTRYAEDLAAVFHQFYAQCRVFDPDAPEVSAARLFAVDATRRALRCALGLLGVSAPERM